MNVLQKPTLSGTLEELGRERLAELLGNLSAAESAGGAVGAEVPERLAGELALVLALSDFVYQTWQINPGDLGLLLDTGALETSRSAEDFDALADACTGEDADLQLRLLRRREQCRFIFRDLTRRSDMLATTTELSGFADAMVRATTERHYRQLCADSGRPEGASGQPLRMAVLALGKQGAGELNLSSDIDLIFFYGEPGDSGKESYAEHQGFFLKLARKLIASLNDTTGEGFVFRVDMRLRPYGESGNLVPSLRAMEDYYVDQGRDWERYAFIKARSIALDDGLGANFLVWLKPFIYRRYLDFGALDSLRSMKLLIVAEVERKKLHGNIKLGSGGIRDIEFIVQTMQLIFGAHNAELQRPRLLKVLPELVSVKLLSEEDAAMLETAYIFLRDVEHRLQSEGDRQTQLLPTSDLSRLRLAQAMNHADWDGFSARLDELRRQVSRLFAAALRMPEADDEEADGLGRWTEAWLETDPKAAIALLDTLGLADAEAVHGQLEEFRQTLDRANLEPMVEDRFNRFMPTLLQILVGMEDSTTILSRVLNIAAAVLRRSTYIAFLLESGRAIETLAYICALAPWVTEQVSAQPMLLYQLDYLKGHDYLPSTDELKRLLRTEVAALEEDDLEGQMDALRRFKLSQEFDTAILALTGDLPVEEVSNQLSWIAEVVLDEVLRLAWQQLVKRHGRPAAEGGGFCAPGFVMVAYGKLGSYELGFSSDIDLVFVHGADTRGSTEGPRELANETFYARLSQRIVHILMSLTAVGRLYEADLRLRPNGDSGPPVVSFASFEEYQREKAWIWEHQALVRARAVAGDPQLMERFEALRRHTLARSRDRAELREAVISMRGRMREHRLTHRDLKAEEAALKSALFDLKQGFGAIVDIEFMVQYLVLCESGEHPELLEYTDNLRLLEALERAGLLSPAERQLAQDAYLAYRTAVHFESLGGRMFDNAYQRLRGLRARMMVLLRRLLQAEEPGWELE